tara:strand:+ start:112 stop:576 length:465 start_codon:yes stop_codon:yes gene_type:complete
MPYIHKTLSEGEVVEQFLKYHWFFMIYPIFLLVIGLSIAISHFLYFSNLNESNLVLYLSYLFFIFSFIKFITRFIERWTTEQALTNKRVFRKVGLIRRDTDELVYEKIETVAVKQSILGRIFNFGEVEFTGTGGMYIRFVFVKNPTEVKRNFKH